MSWKEIAKEFGVHPAEIKSILETSPNSLPRRMAEEIEALREKLDWYQSGDIHTHHDRCKKPECILRRQLTNWQDHTEKLKEALKFYATPETYMDTPYDFCPLMKDTDDLATSDFGRKAFGATARKALALQEPK